MMADCQNHSIDIPSYFCPVGDGLSLIDLGSLCYAKNGSDIASHRFCKDKKILSNHGYCRAPLE
jgi:hypothetical protein